MKWGKMMNDNFKCIYKILRTLEAAMDYTEYDFSIISHAALGISKERWNCYIEMLSENDYIKDVIIRKYPYDNEVAIDISNMKITLKGLEYLSENSIMQRLYNVAKGIKEVTPGL